VLSPSDGRPASGAAMQPPSSSSGYGGGGGGGGGAPGLAVPVGGSLGAPDSRPGTAAQRPGTGNQRPGTAAALLLDGTVPDYAKGSYDNPGKVVANRRASARRTARNSLGSNALAGLTFNSQAAAAASAPAAATSNTLVKASIDGGAMKAIMANNLELQARLRDAEAAQYQLQQQAFAQQHVIQMQQQQQQPQQPLSGNRTAERGRGRRSSGNFQTPSFS